MYHHFSDKGWNNQAANVVCNMLGFDVPYPEATWGFSWGQIGLVDTDYIMSLVSCDGTEKILKQCIYDEVAVNCTGAAGVRCTGDNTNIHIYSITSCNSKCRRGSCICWNKIGRGKS